MFTVIVEAESSAAAGGLLVLVLTAALAAVAFDIVEARDESLGPESSKTMASEFSVANRGRRVARKGSATIARACCLSDCDARCEVRGVDCGRGVGSQRQKKATKHTGRQAGR